MISLSELATAFGLGNSAILTNVCLLPLYPGLVAFLAGSSTNQVSRHSAYGLGIIVLAGVLSMMIFIGFVLHVFKQPFGDVLIYGLPIIYGSVIVLGVLLLTGRNPFARLSLLRSPVFHSPYLTAYTYGLLLGPMTLPCTGPVITSAFLLAAGDGGHLANELLYVLAFGLGFGWPLVIMPFFAVTAQRRFTRFLSQHHTFLNRVSGVLLIAIGIFEIWTELLPNLG